MNIREETELDAQKIGEVTKAAFAHHPYGAHTEHLIVAAPRSEDALPVNPRMILENVPPEYFMVLPFNANNAAMGTVTYHEAFSINSESLDSTVRRKI